MLLAAATASVGLVVPWASAEAKPRFEYRVSAGGWVGMAGPEGASFSADRDYNGGQAAGPFSWQGVALHDLYRKHRWGMTGYTVTVPRSGTYAVRLHFAETVFNDPGRRVFDVTAEGALRIDNLDVVSRVGSWAPLVEELTVDVSDGALDVGFASVVEDPFLSGIEVIATNGPKDTTTVPPPTTTTTAPPPPPSTTTTVPPPTTTTTAPPPPPSTTTTTAPPPPPPTTTIPPSSGTRCPAYPAFPDASCTGVLPGSALTPSGTVWTSFDGQVIENLDIQGSIQVSHNDVTVRNVRVRNPGGTAITVLHKTGLVVEDCELDGSGNPDASSAIAHHNYTMRRCNVHHFGEGPRVNGNVVLEDNYFHDFTNFISQGAHQDCVQVTSGYGFTMRHNSCLIGVDGANAAVMIGSYQGGDILVENNLLGGGGYTAYCGASNGYTNVRYLNNRFSTVYYPNGGYWGPFLYCSNATLSGNVWHDGPKAGQPVG